MRRSGRAKDASFVFAARMAANALVFLAGVLTARIFTPELRGEYAMLFTITAFVSQTANLGFAEAIIYFFRQGHADLRGIHTSIVTFDLLVVGATLLVGLAIVPWLGRQYFPEGGELVAWVALGAGLFGVLRRNALALAQAQHRFLLNAVTWLIQPALFVLWLLVMAWWHPDLQWAAIGFLISWMAGSLHVFLPSVRQFRPASLSRAFWGRVMRFSLKSYAHVAILMANYRLDMFIVAYMLPDLAPLAFYHIAASLVGLIWLLPDSYGVVIYPRLAGYQGERERTREMVHAIRYIMLLVIGITASLAVVAHPLILILFGGDYAESIVLLYILLPGVLLMSLTKILTRYLLSRNQHQWSSFCSVLGVAVNVGANVLLIPPYGVRGAAVAANLGYAVTTLGMVWAVLRLAEPDRTDWSGFPRREIEAYWGLVRSTLRRVGG